MKFDLHTHTKYSRCGILEPRTVLKKANKAGLDGIAITDHNTVKGALKTVKENKNLDFEVIPGCEVSTELGHTLLYYVEEAPREKSFLEVIDFAKSAGAIVSLSHPFRLPQGFGFKEDIKKVKHLINAIECFNGRNMFRFVDEKAVIVAEKEGLAKTGGSDGHMWFEIGRGYTLFEGDLHTAIKKKKTQVGGSHVVSLAGSLMSVFFKNVIHIKKD